MTQPTTSPISSPSVIPSDKSSILLSRHSAQRRIRHLLDRLAKYVVGAGGLGTVISILGIFMYLVWEVIPLFLPATASPELTVPVALAERQASMSMPLMVGIDEYREVPFVLQGTRLQFYSLPDGGLQIYEVEGKLSVEGEPASVARIGLKGHRLSIGTDQGYVYPVQVLYRSEFKGNQRTILPSVQVKDPIQVVPEGQGVILHAYVKRDDESQTVAALAENGELWLTRIEEPGEFSLTDDVIVTTHRLAVPPQVHITTLVLDSGGKRLVAGTQDGHLLEWEWKRQGFDVMPRSVAVGAAGDAVTVLSYLLGDRTLVVGTESGRVSTWVFSANPSGPSGGILRKAHGFKSHTRPVTGLSVSQRDKGFLTADDQGTVFLHYSTTGETNLTIEGKGKNIESLHYAPKGNGVVWLEDGTLQTYAIHNPHPEATFTSLFLPVTYEGYDQPEMIWQSSSGSDEFEPKLGLTPLMFGTLKGTLYAMMLAIPLAVMGAIYTAMFMHPHLRAVVKPSLEIMAALPSVVLGFLAGLWLAPLLEKIFPAVVAIVGLLPLVIAACCLLWQFLPIQVKRLDTYGLDLVVMMVVIVLTVAVCLAANDAIEGWLFGGNFQQWILQNLGLTYDQRNALVISLAMGFAVIPIIFSISEDAIANVPRHLVAGSLALGATRWQTLTRLVLVSASPGIFSALMIGFGRVVGETMIVLMATGNTPIMDWSMFNGFRTLSANIAVEMPEAPHGGTLYRVLFLSGLILFGFTFFINTIAEIIRQRLRQKYSQF